MLSLTKKVKYASKMYKTWLRVKTVFCCFFFCNFHFSVVVGRIFNATTLQAKKNKKNAFSFLTEKLCNVLTKEKKIPHETKNISMIFIEMTKKT